ncbi:MAG TPA: DegV family protein [Candidatus Scatomorpha gallistercoris]|nr:DegV family protein [Candidatus Scatomorpha gallistercoris]
MKKTAIVTDSNSGITPAEAEELGIYLVPMPFFIDGELFYEGVNLSHEDFYSKMAAGADISTSQPTPGAVLDLWDTLLEDHDELVYIPMSSALSGSCATAEALAEDYDGRVTVVDNQRISATQRQSVLDAVSMVNDGQDASRINEVLLRDKLEASIYITVDTLKYLKKGGRITAAAAAFGTVLGIKPVLQIQGEKLDAFAMAHGMKSAKKQMLDAVEKDLETRFAGKKGVYVAAAYTCSDDEAKLWAEEIRARFGERFNGYIAPLSLSVACHTGPGAYGVGCVKIAEW